MHINGYFAGGLRCVNVKQDAFFTAQCTNGRNVLNHTNLVIDIHHTDQDGVGSDGSFERIQIKQAVFLHVQVAYFKAFALKLAHRVKYGFVFGFYGDKVLALVFVKMCCAFDGEVVRLSCAAGPDDFTWVCTNQGCHMAACIFNGFFSLPTPSMAAAGGVAKMLAQPWNHGIDYALINWRGSTVIKINRELRCHAITLCIKSKENIQNANGSYYITSLLPKRTSVSGV